MNYNIKHYQTKLQLSSLYLHLKYIVEYKRLFYYYWLQRYISWQKNSLQNHMIDTSIIIYNINEPFIIECWSNHWSSNKYYYLTMDDVVWTTIVIISLMNYYIKHHFYDLTMDDVIWSTIVIISLKNYFINHYFFLVQWQKKIVTIYDCIFDQVYNHFTLYNCTNHKIIQYYIVQFHSTRWLFCSYNHTIGYCM